MAQSLTSPISDHYGLKAFLFNDMVLVIIQYFPKPYIGIAEDSDRHLSYFAECERFEKPSTERAGDIPHGTSKRVRSIIEGYWGGATTKPQEILPSALL